MDRVLLHNQDKNIPCIKKTIKKIGIYDSGIGGFSVLQPLSKIFPAHYLYFADTAYFPYGSKSPEVLAGRIEHVFNFFLEQGADLIIVACNTLESAIYHRPDLSLQLPVVTIIDFIVNTTLAHLNEQGQTTVGIMATPTTIASGVYQRLLISQNSALSLVTQECMGLAEAIENHNSMRIQYLLESYKASFLGAGVRTIILACTHYHFIKKDILAVMGDDLALMCICQRFPSAFSLLYQSAERAHCKYSFFTSSNAEIFNKKIVLFIDQYADIPNANLIAW